MIKVMCYDISGSYLEYSLQVQVTQEGSGADVVPVYAGAQTTFAEIAALTEDSYDIIVIGNNLGVGVVKARYMPEQLRSRTVIVWNDPPTPSKTAPYRELGFKHFSKRGDALVAHLHQHFDVPAV